MHSEQSAPLFEVLRDPFNGALWSGPPYQSKQWASFTAARNPGSPAWLPSFKDGSLVRFMNQSGKAASSAPWGPMRIVYLQYASDAVTFFEYSSFYREPDWMKPPRGPDVSPSLSWPRTCPWPTKLRSASATSLRQSTTSTHGLS